MNINSIQGMNAYTANALPADTASIQNNIKESTDVELNQESTRTLQEAFQVDITQEALSLQAENTDNLAKEDQEEQLAQQTQQAQQIQFQSKQGSQLDIIA